MLRQWAQGLGEWDVGGSPLVGPGGGLAEGGEVGKDVCGSKGSLHCCCPAGPQGRECLLEVG